MRTRILRCALMLTASLGLLHAVNGQASTLKVNSSSNDARAVIAPASANDPDPTDGLIVPRINAFPGNASGFNNAPAAASKGMLVYLQQSFTGDANAAGYVNGQVYAPGYYYWSGTAWLKFNSTANATATTNATDSSIYNSNGTVTANRIVSLGSKSLTFAGLTSNVNVEGNLTVTGNQYANGNVGVNGNLAANNTLTVGGNSQFNGTLNSFAGALNVTGNGFFGGSLGVNGNLAANNTLTVGGNSQFNGILNSFAGALNVTGNGFFGGSLGVNGNLATTNTLTVGGNTQFNGPNNNFAGALNVTGNGFFGGSLGVNGNLATTNTLTVGGNTQFNGPNNNFAGALNVTGNGFFGGSLGVNGNLATTNTLTVGGNTQFNGPNNNFVGALAVLGNVSGESLTTTGGKIISTQRSNYYLSMQNDRNMVLYDNGAAIFTTGTGVSDIRTKTDIKAAPSLLSKMKELDIIDFKYKPELNLGNEQRFGVIAQELIKTFPQYQADLIYHDKKSDRYIVHYDKLSVIALKAIQEQQAEIEDLKTQKKTAEINTEKVQKAYNELAAQVKEIQQTLGLSPKAATDNKVAKQ